MTLKQIHYFSGVTVSLFIFSHLTNHFAAISGFQEHIKVMDMLRVVYRNPLFEPLLLCLVATQIFSGIRLFFKTTDSPTKFDKIQRISGLYLAIFFCIHVGAVFWGRLLLKLDTNIYFGIAGLNTFPYLLFFVPYYSLAVIAFFAHVASIHSKKMKSAIFGISVDRQSMSIIAGGILFALILMFALTDGFRGASFPTEYNVLVGK